MATRQVMTTEEVIDELDASDSEDAESSGSEDDFGGYLDEGETESEDESDDEDGEGDNGEDPIGDLMETEAPLIPPYTLQPGSSMTGITRDAPIDYFSLFVNDRMLSHIVSQTNMYAQQYMESHTLAPHSRKRQWQKVEHTVDELRKFLALILVMGLVRYPTIEGHWCTTWPYATEAFSSVSVIYRNASLNQNNKFHLTGYETRQVFPHSEIHSPQ